MGVSLVLFGAISGAAFSGAGSLFDNGGMLSQIASKTLKQLTQAAVHGVVGGGLSLLQGGKFGHGFVSSGFAKFMSVGADRLQLKDFGRFMSATITGGTVSSLTGGKFANGAQTAALAFAVNDMGSKYREGRAVQKGCSGQMCRGAGKPSARDRHYARNSENDAFLKEQGLHGRSDLTTDELKQLNFKHVGAPEDKYHTWGPGNENNQKWVFDNGTRYGSYEIVIRPTDTGFMHVMDANVMGTLNYGGNPWSHFWRDVVPYYRYGNNPSDTTTGWQRFGRTFE